MQRVRFVGAVALGAALVSGSASAQSVSDAVVGLIDVRQNDAANDQRSVSIGVPGGATLFSVTNENRGDYSLGFGSGADLQRGVVIAGPRNLARTNADGGNIGGNNGGDAYATVSVNRSEAGRTQWVAVHGAPSGQEMNLDVAAVFFPFDAGFIAGHASNRSNNATLDTFRASPGLIYGLDFRDPTSSNGVYTLDLSRLGQSADDGVLLVCGGNNEDNFALSRPNADGTFTIYCKDNGSNGPATENDPVAFAFLPYETEGLVAGRIAEHSGGAPTVLSGTGGFSVSPAGVGRVVVRIDGVSAGDAGAFLVSPEGGASRNADNIIAAAWDGALGGYIVESLDIPSLTPQGLGGEPMFGFAYFPVTPGPGFERDPRSQTVVALPDTQLYAQNVPDIFHDQTAWVADHAAERDVRMVLHLGDITNRNNDAQWQVARSAYSRILFEVPVLLAQGNHDCGPNGNAADRTTGINQYFPLWLLRLDPTHGGVFEPGRIENSYSLFEWAGRQWIALALEWGPRDIVLDWANGVLSAHEDRLAIVVTHAYMYDDDTRMDQTVRDYGGSPYNYGTADLPGGVSDGGDIYREVISTHPNVMMVLSGHIKGEGLNSEPTPFGNVVHEMLADYQGRAQGGEGFLRLYELSPDSSTIRVRTYSPTQGRYLTGSKSHFDLELVTAPGHAGWACPADLDTNGSLDIDDVLLFLARFGEGAERADLAAPYGVHNIDDVLVFLAGFAAGCS